MEHTLSIKSLFIHLKNVEETEPDPIDHKKIRNKRKAWNELSAGARYLYKRALLPILHGHYVCSSDLNFSMFDTKDITEIVRFYESNVYHHSEHTGKLQRIYRSVRCASPLTKPTVFV